MQFAQFRRVRWMSSGSVIVITPSKIAFGATPSACIHRPFCGIITPMPKIHIPTPLRQYAGKQAAVTVKAGTIADSLNDLVTQHPDLRRHLYTDEGKLRAFVNVYLNDEDVRYMQKDATPVKDSDTISIVPSIAGGE